MYKVPSKFGWPRKNHPTKIVVGQMFRDRDLRSVTDEFTVVEIIEGLNMDANLVSYAICRRVSGRMTHIRLDRLLKKPTMCTGYEYIGRTR